MRIALVITAAIGVVIVGLSVIGYYRVKVEQIDMNSELRQHRDFAQPPPAAFVSNHERRISRLGRIYVIVGVLAGASVVSASVGLALKLQWRNF